MEGNSKFFEFSQNNSGGSFTVDEKLCHRLFIEADSYEEAVDKAENLGCYWNGVDEGMDCSCCGDRWHQPFGEIDLMKMDSNKDGGYPVGRFLYKDDSVEKFKTDYSGMEWIEDPIEVEKYSSRYAQGRVKLQNIEDYARVMANLYGWTSPDARIFYKDGTVKDIFSAQKK